MREICKVYGFNEIRTPAFEDTKLFLRGIGETTDAVSYTHLLKVTNQSSFMAIMMWMVLLQHLYSIDF